MTRPDHKHIFDTEGLQADVMRFMAIIAFCLIAILALVQKLDAPAPEPAIDEPPAAKVVRKPKVIIEPPVVTPAPRPPLVEEVIVTSAEVDVKTVEQDVKEPEASPLILRFVSDQAFLHLIAGGVIELYIGYRTDFFKLTPAFDLIEASPTGQLYELLQNSIPRKVIKAVNREREATSYLVALPKQTRGIIDSLSGQYAGSGGAIVIGADGGVSYEK